MGRVVPDPMAQVHIDEDLRAIRVWLADEVAADARRYAPVDTTYLSTHIEVRDDAHRVVATGAGIPPNEDAPFYVEYGTRPHLIVSHGDYPLRSHRTGQVFGRVVHHPGTPAQPYLRPAAYTRRAIPPWVTKLRRRTAR